MNIGIAVFSLNHLRLRICKENYHFRGGIPS
jgi:hypothetical protein